MVLRIVITRDNVLSLIVQFISSIQETITMKTDMTQQTQRILNLIAKRDLDDDGKSYIFDKTSIDVCLFF